MNILSLTSRFPIFFTFVLLSIIFMLNIRRSNKRIKKNREEFWAKEIRANSVRRKPLDNVDFIKIPYEELPMDTDSDDEIIAECVKQLNELNGEPIANFTGITNTDLKLEYGAPNITTLSRADSNFTILVRTLQNLGDRLHTLGRDDDALTVLEYAIRIRSDISATYYLAGQLYSEKGDTAKIAWLKRNAEALNTIMVTPILRKLNDTYPDIPAY
ncbi:MAG: tetratricopeptide repeat protein [Lachnospiraceae bacterium]|nr:tetratricopeptide repeat protein [Lachnospiraceae bacterium]